MSNLSPQNLVLLIAGVINLVMSLFVFSRGVKNKVNLYFSLLTLLNFIWAVTILIGRVYNDGGMLWYYLGSLLAYPVALLIAIFLYYFCVYFPVKLHEPSNLKKYLLILPIIFFSVLVYIKGGFILSYSRDIQNTEYTLYVNKPLHILYAMYFIFVVVLALKELFYKIKMSESFFKKQIIILFIAIFLGLIFGTYFDLFLCYFANYHYIWLGPIFTVFMNIVVFYFIISPKEKIHA